MLFVSTSVNCVGILFNLTFWMFSSSTFFSISNSSSTYFGFCSYVSSGTIFTVKRCALSLKYSFTFNSSKCLPIWSLEYWCHDSMQMSIQIANEVQIVVLDAWMLQFNLQQYAIVITFARPKKRFEMNMLIS